MKIQEVTKEHVENRINDFLARVNALYSQLKIWSAYNPEVKFFEGTFLQNEEELMIKFNVEPRMFPSIAFLYRNNRVSFVPMGLFIIGANGRLNISTSKSRYALVDFSEYGESPSDWKFVFSLVKKQWTEFDEKIFRSLIEKGEVPNEIH